MRKVFVAVAVLGLLVSMVALAAAQPRPMAEDVFTPIAKGYDFMRAAKYEAAEYEFKDALKKDRYNPFALNNLAALEEKKGKLKDALAYLTDANEHAKEYFNKVEQTCFIDGICAAVKPLKTIGTESTIAPIIQENMTKLQGKVKGLPAEPSKPSKM